MKRKDMLTRLNQLTLKYNLRWEDIKYDADKAIDEINTLLGAKYPLLSDILLTDDSSYTIRVENEDVKIIEDKYFHSVILPYIALEILAREEEFTTIYSKYQAELAVGKAVMFSKEFNYVPDRFKRSRSEGVFFASKNEPLKQHRSRRSKHKEDNPYE